MPEPQVTSSSSQRRAGAPVPPPGDTARTGVRIPLKTDLERDRRRRRAARIEAVLRELHARARAREADDGPVPPPLLQAISGFEQELAETRRGLGRLER
jgi:hypothetical protein